MHPSLIIMSGEKPNAIHRMAEAFALNCSSSDCDYRTAAMPPQFALCQLSVGLHLLVRWWMNFKTLPWGGGGGPPPPLKGPPRPPGGGGGAHLNQMCPLKLDWTLKESNVPPLNKYAP